MEKENSILNPLTPLVGLHALVYWISQRKKEKLFKPLQLFEDGSPGLRGAARVAPI
jgi:hypothetical protein